MKKTIVWLVITFCMAFISGHVFALDIEFFTHSLKGQTYVDEKGELRGHKYAGKRAFNLELVREMMTTMNHSKKMKEVPFKRGFVLVQNGSNKALFNVSRTAEREILFKWVGPLQREVDYFYEMRNAPTGISSLGDAKKVRKICVLNGSIHETILRKKNFKNIHTNTSYVNCFKMLKNGRVDLTPKASSTVSKILEKAEISPKEIHQTPVILLESGGYLAFSKKIPDKIVQKWQDAFDQIKRFGKYQQLYNDYYLSKDDQ